MPRITIITTDGTPLAQGIYPLTDARLLNPATGQDILPNGSFLCLPSPLLSPIHGLEDGLWLSHSEKIGDWPRTNHFIGCCGPDGSNANILHPHLNTPVAYEFADCHTYRAIRVAPGKWSEVIESEDAGVTWISHIAINGGTPQYLAAATGRDEREARHRLERASAAYIDRHWHRRSKAWREQHLAITAMPASEWLG